MSIFDVASRQAEWLSLRRAHVASNIANVNTPGYRARDVLPFEEFMQRAATPTAGGASGSSAGLGAADVEPEDGVLTETLQTGNNVNLENELLKSSEIARNHALNVGMVRAFHRMLLLSSKG